MAAPDGPNRCPLGLNRDRRSGTGAGGPIVTRSAYNDLSRRLFYPRTMTEWFRQHRESIVFRMPRHIEDPTPTKARMLGLLLAMCGTTIASEGRGIDRMEDPPLDDRCAVCQGAWLRGET